MHQIDRIIDGKMIADQIANEVKSEGEQFFQKMEIKPNLSAIILGENPAATFYVRMIERTCKKVGFDFTKHALKEETTEDELLSLLQELNKNNSIHGVIVQTPLPKHINEDRVREAVASSKDVDCFNPINMGKLAMGNPDFLPCTPNAVFEILKREKIAVEGRHVVIVGRSSVVGKPLALILLLKHPHANASVTICHSRTSDLAALTRAGDILVAAVGIARLIKGSMVKEGAIVIDVGTNEEGGKLVGDVDFEEVSPVASKITPVPGGVGPVTNMMLMKNTLQAARKMVY